MSEIRELTEQIRLTALARPLDRLHLAELYEARAALFQELMFAAWAAAGHKLGPLDDYGTACAVAMIGDRDHAQEWREREAAWVQGLPI